jgi:hypothetical protein
VCRAWHYEKGVWISSHTTDTGRHTHGHAAPNVALKNTFEVHECASWGSACSGRFVRSSALHERLEPRVEVEMDSAVLKLEDDSRALLVDIDRLGPSVAFR